MCVLVKAGIGGKGEECVDFLKNHLNLKRTLALPSRVDQLHRPSEYHIASSNAILTCICYSLSILRRK